MRLNVPHQRSRTRLSSLSPSALIWRERMGPMAEMATHDTALGAAARAFGFGVRGI